MKRWLLTLVIAFPCWGDIVELKDGRRFEGDLKRTAEGYEITSADGSVTRVRSDQVASMRLTGRATTTAPSAANERFASLKRSVEGMSDLDQILARFRSFIEQNKDQPIADEAKREMALWEDRKARGLVKVSVGWVTPQQRERLLAGTTGLAFQARDALRQNHVKDAEALVAQILELDPSNPPALYLQGVMLYRSDKIAVARRSFEQVVQALPDHAASLNNVAVVYSRQNDTNRAMGFLDRAMVAMPDNKEILNNVLELLMAMPENQRKSAAVQKVQRRFAEQDMRLVQLMARYGWYRWGSLWVDQGQIDHFREQEKTIRAKMADMQKEYDANDARIKEIEARVETNDRYMRALRDRSFYRDANGVMQQMSLPPEYYDIDRENQRLIAERDALAGERNRMKEQARDVEAQLPAPRFTGVLQLIGVEGTPLPANADPPASQPAGPSMEISIQPPAAPDRRE